jgi:hypothetical protein
VGCVVGWYTGDWGSGGAAVWGGAAGSGGAAGEGDGGGGDGGAGGAPDSSGGGGGGGSGDVAELDAVVGTDVGTRSTLESGLRTASRTSEITIAAVANVAATSATAAPRVRYHGTGVGLKFQVLESNASKLSASLSVAASVASSVSGAASDQRESK